MKRLIGHVKEYVDIYINDSTGIVWVEDGTTGNTHSCHPNIDASGSLAGMKKLGYWKSDAITVKCNGTIYNISVLSVTDKLDEIAAEHCKCASCITRKNMQR